MEDDVKEADDYANDRQPVNDCELLDFADAFCERRGGSDRFATLGLSLPDSDSTDSFRDALRKLMEGQSKSIPTPS